MSSERSQRPVWLGEDRRGWDHARIHRQVVEDSRLGAYEVGVYVGLAIHAETMSGECYPAVATLAAYLGCGDRTVEKALVTLRDAHYIEVDHRPGKASVYRLLPPPSSAATPAGDAGVRGATPAAQTGDPRSRCATTPAGGADELEPLNENQEQPPSSPRSHKPRPSRVAEEERATPDPITEAGRIHADRAFRDRSGNVGDPAAWKAKVRKAWIEEFEDECVGLLTTYPSLDGKALLGKVEHQPSDGLGYRLTGAPPLPEIDEAELERGRARIAEARANLPTNREQAS